MRITPLDVRKQEFRKAVRGFDCDEVRAFLSTLADEYETVLVDNKQIRDQNMELDDKISEYQTMERTLRDTLMTAEKLMQETRETANKEGDIIIQGAYQKAKFVLEDCRLRTEELRREIVGLRKEKETYLARFKGLAESQISFIQSHKDDFADLDKRLVDLADSVVDGSLDYEAQAKSPAQAKAPSFQSLNPVDVVEEHETVHQTVDPPVNAEVDMWRDYAPGNKESAAVAIDQAQDTPMASSDAPTSQPEAMVNEMIAETEEAPAASAEGVSDAMVNMAALGIPIPAVSAGAGSEAEEESEAINKVITSALSENPHLETQLNS